MMKRLRTRIAVLAKHKRYITTGLLYSNRDASKQHLRKAEHLVIHKTISPTSHGVFYLGNGLQPHRVMCTHQVKASGMAQTK